MHSSDITLADVAEPMKDLFDKLSSENRASWLEAFNLTLRMPPHLLIAKLKEFALKLYKKINIGGIAKGEFLEKFKVTIYKVGNDEKVGIQLSGRAHNIAGKPECVFPIEVESVEFVVGSLGKLFGFKSDKETQVFLNEAFLAMHNLELCEPSDAFYLRQNLTDQPLDEWIRVGHKPITTSDNRPRVFSLAHNSCGMWLHANNAHSSRRWGPNYLWIFRHKNL